MELALLNKYIHDWNLKNCKRLASTFTSDVYVFDSKYGKAVLKILNEVGVKDELPGTFFLDNCRGEGSAKLYEFDERALLIEFLPGENLYQFSKIGNEKEASKVFCEIIKKIHLVKDIKNRERLSPLSDLFKIFGRVNVPKDLVNTFNKAEALAKELMATQTHEVLLHGDLHHENIISREDGEFVCFDPKGMIGDPAYELGTTLKNPRDYPEISQNIECFVERAKFFSEELKLPYDRIVGFAFIHVCLSMAWSIEDGFDYPAQLDLAKKIEPLV